MPVSSNCPVCFADLEYTIGEYYTLHCGCGRYSECGYHYGYDLYIDGEEFHFDESGYGNKENQERYEEKLKQVAAEQNGNIIDA